MKRGTKIKLWIGIPLFLFISLFLFFLLKYTIVTPFDYPYRLEDKEQVIEVYHVAWACDCADWLEAKYYNDSNYDVIKDCVFIEASNSELNLPNTFWNNPIETHLKLTGSFYKSIGIPRNYIKTDDGKPDKARVFRYTKIEIVKNK